MSQRGKHKMNATVKEDITCNVIPMIDIMFLLLLFFMLGADMGQREMAELVLPEASDAKVVTDKGDKEERRTVINVQYKGGSNSSTAPTNLNASADIRGTRSMELWTYVVRGQHYDYLSLKEQLQGEANENLEDVVDEKAGKKLSKLFAVIRADKDAPYGMVQKAIEVCGLVGIYKIEIVAAKPEAGTPGAG